MASFIPTRKIDSVLRPFSFFNSYRNGQKIKKVGTIIYANLVTKKKTNGASQPWLPLGLSMIVTSTAYPYFFFTKRKLLSCIKKWYVTILLQ